jgi:two-component system phosphate regulon response regulator PhoB
MAAKILLVEDESAIQSLIIFHLNQAGYQVFCANDAEQALVIIRQQLPDLLILDLMLPGISGLEMIRRLRADQRTNQIPIILLTARSEEQDKITGLNTGADDYITKPFSPRELRSRIHALLRRSKPHLCEEPLRVGHLVLDPVSHSVHSKTMPIKLGPTEFRLLHFFMTHLNRAYTRTQLLDQIWGDHVFIGERTVDVHIRRLRVALKATHDENRLQTIHGSGYRFSDSLS